MKTKSLTRNRLLPLLINTKKTMKTEGRSCSLKNKMRKERYIKGGSQVFWRVLVIIFD